MILAYGTVDPTGEVASSLHNKRIIPSAPGDILDAARVEDQILCGGRIRNSHLTGAAYREDERDVDSGKIKRMPRSAFALDDFDVACRHLIRRVLDNDLISAA